ncbi:hypothetical protein CYMTET_34391 [Cymbomonas tetramitiformis]|uniref:Uncharacterized protein n=1 Tax=Cymbomonas tetramitiformis TaxID=36881 RepID=A0AAE0KQ00_9CHLO|nr:hypothetical protein CYMTET_34391 [Cymbomonas tetramitiformis]
MFSRGVSRFGAAVRTSFQAKIAESKEQQSLLTTCRTFGTGRSQESLENSRQRTLKRLEEYEGFEAETLYNEIDRRFTAPKVGPPGKAELNILLGKCHTLEEASFAIKAVERYRSYRVSEDVLAPFDKGTTSLLLDALYRSGAHETALTAIIRFRELGLTPSASAIERVAAQASDLTEEEVENVVASYDALKVIKVLPPPEAATTVLLTLMNAGQIWRALQFATVLKQSGVEIDADVYERILRVADAAEEDTTELRGLLAGA